MNELIFSSPMLQEVKSLLVYFCSEYVPLKKKCVCVPAIPYVYHVHAATLRVQKKALNAFQQELQVVSCRTWVLETEPSPLQELHLLLTIEPPFQLHIYLNIHTHERERARKRGERALLMFISRPSLFPILPLSSFLLFFVLSLKNTRVPSMREDRRPWSSSV